MIERGCHDLGGLPAGPVEHVEHEYAEWEMRTDALVMLLCGIKGPNKRMTVDELRKNIEALGSAAYNNMSYYERWIASLAHAMMQRGIVTTEEMAKKMAQIESRAKRQDT